MCLLLLLLLLVGIDVGVLLPGVVGHEVGEVGPLVWRVVGRLRGCHDIWRRCHASTGVLCIVVVVVVVVDVVVVCEVLICARLCLCILLWDRRASHDRWCRAARVRHWRRLLHTSPRLLVNVAEWRSVITRRCSNRTTSYCCRTCHVRGG